MLCERCGMSFDIQKKHSCSAKCLICHQTFSHKKNLKRHMNTVHKRFLCELCGLQLNECLHVAESPKKRRTDAPSSSSFRNNINLDVSSSSSFRNNINLSCCGQNFATRMKYKGHLRSQQHINNHTTALGDGITQIASSFKNSIANYRILCNNKNVDIPTFLENVQLKSCNLINNVIKERQSVKLQLELFAFFVKNMILDELVELKSFNTQYTILTEFSNIENIYQELSEIIKIKSEEFQERDSGFALLNVSHLEINLNSFNPLKGSSYIKLPAEIEKKKACINIKCYDNACFAWSIVAALQPTNLSANRTASYPHYSQVLRLEGINFPIKIKDVPKIEAQNNLSINIYELTQDVVSNKIEVVGPIYFTMLKRDVHINLLYLENSQGSHFVLIRNLSRLVSSQISTHGHKIFLCDGCLINFPSQNSLDTHVQFDCNKVYTILPNTELKLNKIGQMIPANILKFNDYEKQLTLPYVVYADFEAMLKPVLGCEPPPNSSHTMQSHQHVPYSFAYKIVCSFDDSQNKFVTYAGLDCTKVFISSLTADALRIYNNHLKIVKPMDPLTADQKHLFDEEKICHICKLLIKDNKVADHDHLTGQFRGAAHSTCNLNFKIPKFLPVFFHNLSGYDLHLFIKDLAYDDESIEIIPLNKEKYISISKSMLVDKYIDKNGVEKLVYFKLRFLDSFRFMSSSLEKLAKNLSSENFVHVKSHFPEDEKFNLIRKKGIFPYQYISDFEKLYETSLPSKEDFFDSLTNTSVSDIDYEHAQTVWNTFACSNLLEYSNLYLKTDVLLLTDIFENFRSVTRATYQLDPPHFLTCPSLTWSAMLKYTKIELELITDINMHHFVKQSIRGGISQCSLRYSQANNKYMHDYDVSKPSSYLTYWDANNLYGWAMSQFLPYGGFKWLSGLEIANFNVSDISDVADVGYILEVDVEYPHTLHEMHNDLPFLVENLVPPNSEFKNTKLIANLYHKEKYIVHYRNLKQALQHGLKIQKIHRILEFKQSPWLKNYIDLNTGLRQKATNCFTKDFYKLMNNASFGKTMENVDKRVDVKLLTHWNDLGKKRGASSLIAKLNFRSCTIFEENLVAIQMQRLKVVYNKPIYVGFCVLELSKLLMYDFYYNFLKPMYQEKVALCYMDTDSFILNIHTDDMYEDMKRNLAKFDTSNFPDDNTFKIPCQNKAVLGLFKDENAGRIQTEFIGLRSKMYANKVEDKVTKKAKGVKKNVVRDAITFDDYKNCLFTNELVYRKQNLFRTYKHTIYSITQNKLALSPHDNKRHINEDGIHTVAWGHYKITEKADP